MATHYGRHFFRLHVGVPDVVGVDKNHGTFLMAAGAGVTEHGRRSYASPLDRFPEHVEKVTATLGAAASLAWGGAHEDLTELSHALILCRGRDNSSRGTPKARCSRSSWQ